MTASAAIAPSTEFTIEQRWDGYTTADHQVWALLYARRIHSLREHGSEAFLRGVEAIGLRPDRVPDLREVNCRLEALTGWNAVPVSGFIPAAAFFAMLAERRFPTTVGVRPMQQLDYLPEPDIFHDVFGHVPLHSDARFATFLQRFGAIASRASTAEEVTRMARLFWFTVEFGLIRERGAIRVYGSGLISSSADAANALGPKCDRRPFSLEAVLEQPFEIDHYQDVLFVIDSFDEIAAALERLG